MAYADQFVISTDDEGIHHAISSGIKVSVIPDENGGKVYRRVQIKPFAEQKRRSVLVAELNGVYVYIENDNIIVTNSKLM